MTRPLNVRTSRALSLVIAGASCLAASAAPAVGEPETKDAARVALAELEARVPALDEGQRRLVRKALATAAFDAGDRAKATRYATELVSPSPNTESWDRGNELHIGHLVLGRLALRAGDVGSARKHLVEAGHTPGSPQLETFGPNMSLAKELLERGERKTVVEYLVLCASFWGSGRHRGVLTGWAQAIEKGEMPDFRANLNYGWYNPRSGSVLYAKQDRKRREVTAGEREVIAEVQARVREAARKDLLSVYVQLKGNPAGTPSADELERAIAGAIPPDELTRAVDREELEMRGSDGPRRTAAERYAAVRYGIFHEVVDRLSQRIPRERISAVLAAYVTMHRESLATGPEK
jgi:hypothetical protein